MVPQCTDRTTLHSSITGGRSHEGRQPDDTMATWELEPTIYSERRWSEATLMTLAAATELQWRPPEVEAGIQRAKVELERQRVKVELAAAEGVEGSEWPQQRWCDVWPSQSRSTKGAWRGQMPNGHCWSWGRKECRHRSQSQEEEPRADRRQQYLCGRHSWGLRGTIKENAKNQKKQSIPHGRFERRWRGRLGGVSTTDDEESHLGIMKGHREFISPQ